MRIRFRGFSTFRARIFWSVIPILVAMLIFHGVMDLREHRRLFTDEFMRRGEAMASNLAYTGELGVFAENRKLLESSMRGVAGDLDDVVRLEARVDLPGHPLELLLERLQLAVQVHARSLGEALQLPDLQLELHDRALEREPDPRGLAATLFLHHQRRTEPSPA